MNRPLIFSLWLGFLLFVVYGSLVPLDYRPMPMAQAWTAFQHIPYLNLGLGSRADWVANGVLYVPLGYLSATVLMRAQHPIWNACAMLLATVFCCAVATGVEFTQLFFPPRTVSQNDLFAESIGSVVGIAVAPLLLSWLRQLGMYWSLGGEQLKKYLLQAYAVGYLLLSFFPYDFLLSEAEVLGKLNSGNWGWLLAKSADRPAMAALHLVVEVALAIPIGLLVARRAGSGFLPGLMLGLVIEGVQFFIETAISQGLSVVTRTVAVMLGVALWRRRESLHVEYWREQLQRRALLLAPAYLLVLSVANGWTVQPLHGLHEALVQWHTVHLLPFYYHYYTSEARALVSLGSVALMYMPLAVLAWALRWRLHSVLVISGLSSLLVETSKLFLTGARPDPTNIIIAIVACAVAFKGLDVLTREGPAPGATPVEPNDVPVSLFPGKPLLLASGLAVIAVQAMLFPAFAPGLLVLLVVCAGAVWWRPVLALAILPAAMPVLDLAPWSGRLYWDEFDLLMVVCLLVGFVRTKAPSSRHPTRRNGAGVGFGLLAISFAVSTLTALWPWQPLDADSFTSYTSHFNALRIVKGGLWAWIFVLFYSRLADQRDLRMRLFSTGMQCGLALTMLFVLWERQAFAGLLDFASDYRVTGPFSAMHKGGAYIECYLAVAAAFALGGLLQARSWRSRWPSAVLLLLAIYGVMVTFSRNGYAALAAIVLVMLAAHLLTGSSRLRRVAVSAGVLALVAAIAVPIAIGPYASARLAATGNDLGVRQAHWNDALAMRDTDWLTTLIGVGIGRFPAEHLWRSKEARHAATYSIKNEAGNPTVNQFLRLGTGAPLYMEQIVSLEPGRDYVFAARLRSNRADAQLSVMLCEKWMLTSARCASAKLKTGAKPDVWYDVQATLATAVLHDTFGHALRPLKLALVAPARDMTLDIDSVRVDAWPAPDVVRNGNFSAGLDHWFFTTDVDPPWHIHSLPVAILFDQGWLGALAWSLVLGLAFGVGIDRARKGSLPALTVSAALLGFLVSGSLNTLIDAPRFLWLLLVLAWLCRADDDGAPSPVSRRGRRRTVRAPENAPAI